MKTVLEIVSMQHHSLWTCVHASLTKGQETRLGKKTSCRDRQKCTIRCAFAPVADGLLLDLCRLVKEQARKYSDEKYSTI